jgi:hypothetical protein
MYGLGVCRLYIKDESLSRLRTGLDLQAQVHTQHSLDPAELDFSEIQGTEDLTTHRGLWSDRPCLSLAVHSSSDGSTVVATEILIPVWSWYSIVSLTI